MNNEERLELQDDLGETTEELKRIEEEDLKQERCNHKEYHYFSPCCWDEINNTDIDICPDCGEHTGGYTKVCDDCGYEKFDDSMFI